MATVNDPEWRAGEDGSGRPTAPTDLHAFAVALRRMNGEINRLVHAFAGDHGLHATDVQALAAILDAEVPMTPKRLREHLGLTSGAVTACVDRLEVVDDLAEGLGRGRGDRDPAVLAEESDSGAAPAPSDRVTLTQRAPCTPVDPARPTTR
ncbi:MarR family transcriptional regulator [Streptomyces europaeiscabiei]|uniref:MarR family transcriptional regulator n=1 Tax=Streptomyces europaeiscabiei TaxID=146819 RepID=UPI003990A45A